MEWEGSIPKAQGQQLSQGMQISNINQEKSRFLTPVGVCGCFSGALRQGTMGIAWKAQGRLKHSELQLDFKGYFPALGVSGIFIHNSQFTPKIPNLPLDIHNRSQV